MALSYILRFEAHPVVGDWGDTSMHKTVEGMADVTVEQATQGQWVSWLGFTFIPAYLEATLKPV